ncbi:MBL fold metallo-hydrolase [Mycolicibacterium litorale]|uniref:MBL fold metallo-hydrolase n=1 Tax=Mycolicibacterium litorale TaxID=758802 RepID=A0A6S6PBS8_9MYCO|nr:MBL fold metallo-hydrolase [Mycolicibacterium litorale]BCI55171.1 MBL fold metallo-hydrolase [Mycolicibacterium litorale]
MLGVALRFGFGTASVLAGGWVLRALQGTPASLGATPAEIHPVAKRSANYRDGSFVNLEPAATMSLDAEARRMLLRELVVGRDDGRPGAPIPVVTPRSPDADAAGLAAYWHGHSTTLIEVDGYRVLTDPIWSDRCSPSRTVGPQRMHEPPVPLEQLPAVDAVLISHDHYDHLDIDTILGLARTQRAPFCVPLGVGAHLRKWGISDARIVELDWNESHRIGELTLVCTPARHFSGRLFSRNTTLWSSWVISGPRHRAFFGGDTGYTASFAEIGSQHGPFDLTLMPVGAYHPAWPDIHMNPEEAVRAHQDMTDAGGGVLLPVHWGTFRLAPHPWAEPVQRLLAAAEPAGVRVVVPKPGQRVERGASPAIEQWWQL